MAKKDSGTQKEFICGDLCSSVVNLILPNGLFEPQVNTDGDLPSINYLL